jgi:hypothetical protein
MAIRLEAGGPNERVKNENSKEEEATAFKITSTDY